MKNKRAHLIHPYLSNPYHPISICLIGCGGTGSQVLQGLARINVALKGLGHPGISVTAYDPDEVAMANLGRQLFTREELGMNKAIALITRINRFFGFSWEAKPKAFTLGEAHTNIFISCVDSVKSRKEINKIVRKYARSGASHTTCYYWLDFGNGKDFGQVVLGTISQGVKSPHINLSDGSQLINEKILPHVLSMFPKMKDKKADGPSCSIAEALGRQDLFINTSLAALGCNLLWKLFREPYIEYHGFFLNLKSFSCNPIPITGYKEQTKRK